MPTSDELQAALKALGDKLPPYECAPEFLRVIKATEAHAAAQQQRIDGLEKALEPFASRYRWDNLDLDMYTDETPVYVEVKHLDALLPGEPIITRKEFRRAYEALRGKGA